jgi:hypothetical protein
MPLAPISHNATYAGLEGWIKHAYEHLGWMYIAKRRGDDAKVQSYKKSLDDLMDILNKKDPKNANKKQDVEIMKQSVAVLKEAVAKLL